MKKMGKIRRALIKKLGGYAALEAGPICRVRTVLGKTVKLGAQFMVCKEQEMYGETHGKRLLCELLSEKLTKMDLVEIVKTPAPEGVYYSATLTVVVPED